MRPGARRRMSGQMFSIILRGVSRDFTPEEQLKIAREVGIYDLDGASWLFANWEPGVGSRALFTEEEIKDIGEDAKGTTR